jgi:uncharacterized membrane protein
MHEHLELPRPLRLLRCTGLSLSESVGLPLAAYVLGAWLGGQTVGLLVGTGAIWLTALIRKIFSSSVPSLLTISAIVLTLQTVLVLATGELWIFLLQFPLGYLIMFFLFARTARGPNPLAAEVVALRHPAHHPGLHRFFQGATWLWSGIFLVLTASLGVMMVTETASMFMLLSTVATIALTVAGIGASVLWFISVLRKHGLRVRFAAA